MLDLQVLQADKVALAHKEIQDILGQQVILDILVVKDTGVQLVILVVKDIGGQLDILVVKDIGDQ